LKRTLLYKQMQRQKRISGLLLDRFDIHIDVPRLEYDKLAGDRSGEPSDVICQRVNADREQQHARFAEAALSCNADTGPEHIREFYVLDDTSQSLMRNAMTQLSMSAHFSSRVKIGKDDHSRFE